jgi:two-component system LytT family response regulator
VQSLKEFEDTILDLVPFIFSPNGVFNLLTSLNLMIKAIIVDDEKLSRNALSVLLHKHCPAVKVLAECGSAAEGLKAIKEHHPQVVFLDVEMPLMNGFEMLQQLETISFEIIFTTGYDAYAIKAIKFSALDYLLKPIEKDELIKALAKVHHSFQHPLPGQLDILLQQLGSKPIALQKIALPTLDGFKLVSIENILRCESDGNYTHVFLKKGEKLLVSRQLKEMEDLLEGHPFLRVHHSHVVNLNEITQYVRGEGGWVVMSDNTTINVSRSRKEALLNLFKV